MEAFRWQKRILDWRASTTKQIGTPPVRWTGSIEIEGMTGTTRLMVVGTSLNSAVNRKQREREERED